MRKYRFLLQAAAMLLCAALVLSLAGCGQNSGRIDYSGNPVHMEDNADAVQNLTVTYSSELTTTNPACISYAHEQEFITNIYDTLTAIDTDGQVIPSVALSWEHSDDYTVWTFHLRDDCYWVNYKGEIMGTVTAQDFVTGLEFVVNYRKSGGSGAYAVSGIIAGAEDYLNYTMSLDEEEARSLPEETFTDMVGIAAPDDVTVVITTGEPCTFLPSVVCSASYVPASKQHIDEIGIDSYIINSYQTAWFNGPYLLTEFVKNSVRILDANPHWYGNDEHTRFLSVTYKCVTDSSLSYQLYQNGEVDETALSQSQLKRILEDEDNAYHGKTVTRKTEGISGFLVFNYDKADDENWNKAIANTAFRRTFVYGLNNYPICQYFNRANPEAVDVKTLQPYGCGFLSDGTAYKDLVLSMLDYDEEVGSMVKNRKLYEQYRQQAIEELTAEGVTFPVQIDYYVSASSSSAISYARIMKAMIEDSLGTDFVTLNIETYSSSYYLEVASVRAASLVESGYAFDYADPSNVLRQFLTTNETYIGIYSCISNAAASEEAWRSELRGILRRCDDMFAQANSITDNDERLYAFAELETYLIDNGIAIPCFNQRVEMLSNIDESSMAVSAMSGYDKRYVDLKTHRQ